MCSHTRPIDVLSKRYSLVYVVCVCVVLYHWDFHTLVFALATAAMINTLHLAAVLPLHEYLLTVYVLFGALHSKRGGGH